MQARHTRWVTVALVAVALILGVGVATFFLGTDDGAAPETAAEYVDLDLGTAAGSSATMEEPLYLPWGSGPTDASRKGEVVAISTIEAVFSSGGLVFIVDHPEGVVGARVRWFSQDGVLAGTTVAPSGSTFFRPHEGGFNYVVAKSGGRSETAVIFDVGTSTETTYAVPLQLNSGGLVYSDGTLYASATPSDVDFEAEVIYSREVIVPVAIDGVPVGDATADAGALELWGFGLDGRAYSTRTQVMGLDVSSSDVITTVTSGEDSVRVPRRYRLLGVGPDSRVYLRTMPGEAIVERPAQLSAAWTSATEPFDEVLVVTLDGTIDSCITLPYSSMLVRYDGTAPMSLCEDGLYTLRADEGGVTVVVHRFQ